MERIARDTRWFKFVEGCGSKLGVVPGDARLQLAASSAR